ncbi:hypothetical protein [Actinoplanes xinjiangensis]|uniref:Uncharacterized protein n=1 Tax=Actinoplanes xinjiangensis TaxID=512350 RepID=A0A316F5U2_9ACTN|nr:hypothetical protein [Actinoplanes xinjiangensis]PWK40077.1 hypothetical protein BC793_12016 [Actinoplanes xinjiangensis]
MTTRDPIDDLLTAAGERWRAAQPPPPEPDTSRWVTPKRRNWLVPVGAAAATILAAGALVFATHRAPPEPTPGPAIVAADPAATLIVRDGDLVEASGRVEDAQMCAPAPVAGDSCPYGIDVPGVAPTDGATLHGRWHPGELSEIRQMPYSPSSAGSGGSVYDLPLTPPCAAPPGGWPADEEWGTPEVEDPLRDYLRAHADRFAEPFATHSGDARILVVRVVDGDVAEARAALAAVYTANLCVVAAPGSRTIAADEELRATVGQAVGALMDDRSLGIYSAAPEDGKMRVQMVQLTQPLYDRLVTIGLDRLILDPWIRPVAR